MQEPEYLDLLQKPPQYILLCWVALVRNNDSSLPSEDRWRCPFAWCETTFADGDHMALISHVSTCPQFSHGSYVCPYHNRRPESFMAAEAGTGHRTRRHFFRHAFGTICKLGSKGIRKAIHPSRAGSKVEFKIGEKRLRSEPDFKDVLPAYELPPELPNNELAGSDDADNAILALQPAKRVSRSIPSELSNARSTYFEMEGVIPEPDNAVAELAGQRMSYLSTSENVTGSGFNSDFSNSPVSPISSSHWLDSHDFSSPISPDVAGFPSRPFSFVNEQQGLLQPHGQNGCVNPQYLDASTHPAPRSVDVSLWTKTSNEAPARNLPKISIDTACTTSPSEAVSMPPPQRNGVGQDLGIVPSPLQIESDTRSPVKLTEELRGLFHQLFKLSCTKISQPPVSPAGAALFRIQPNSATFFEKGCKALGKLIRGVLPTSFWEIFGLAHLAFAASLADQELDLAELLPEMYEDLVRWSEAIKIPNDKAGYLDLIRQLFTPENSNTENLPLESQAQISGRARRVYTNSTNVTLNDLNRLWSSARPTNQPEAMLQDQNIASSTHSLLVMLRQGIIAQLCLRFLTGE